MINNIIDISHYQGHPDFEKVKGAGIIAVIHKASQGITMTDKRYETNGKNAHAQGLMWGAYHWGTGSNIKKQVDHFLSIANETGTLYCLDYEDASMNIEKAVEFLNLMKERTGKYPVLYGGIHLKNEIRRVIKNQDILEVLVQCPLWVSHYTAKPAPTLPVKPWKLWTMWQYTDSGRVPGIAGNVDRNRFNGSIEGLKRLWGVTT